MVLTISPREGINYDIGEWGGNYFCVELVLLGNKNTAHNRRTNSLGSPTKKIRVINKIKPLKIYIAYVGINPESNEVTLLEADLNTFTNP